jgi:hypothetical protein
MRTIADVERFLSDHVKYHDFGGGLFIVTDDTAGLRNLAIKVTDDVVVFQLRVLDLPTPGAKGREELFEKLLRLNNEGLLHAAFTLGEDGIYLQAALPLANLDPNEMQAVLDDMGMAVSQHIPHLPKLSNAN